MVSIFQQDLVKPISRWEMYVVYAWTPMDKDATTTKTCSVGSVFLNVTDRFDESVKRKKGEVMLMTGSLELAESFAEHFTWNKSVSRS